MGGGGNMQHSVFRFDISSTMKDLFMYVLLFYTKHYLGGQQRNFNFSYWNSCVRVCKNILESTLLILS